MKNLLLKGAMEAKKSFFLNSEEQVPRVSSQTTRLRAPELEHVSWATEFQLLNSSFSLQNVLDIQILLNI